MSDISFKWNDEDPVALIIFIFIIVALLMVPWQDFDPTEELKAGAVPQVEAPAEATP